MTQTARSFLPVMHQTSITIMLIWTAFALIISGTLATMPPEISVIDCLYESDADLCLEVDFGDETDIAELDQQEETCIFEGNFMGGSNARVFVSSQDGCPIDESSDFDVSLHSNMSKKYYYYGCKFRFPLLMIEVLACIFSMWTLMMDLK